MTHYEHLAQMFPFEDAILVNKRCEKIIKFSRDWTKARTHYARVVGRVRRVMWRICMIERRLSAKLYDPNGKPLYTREVMDRVFEEKARNTVRKRHIMLMADRYLGMTAADELWMDVRNQFGHNTH